LKRICASSWTIAKKQEKTSLPSEGFELSITTIKRRQAYVLDGTATGIGTYFIFRSRYIYTKAFSGKQTWRFNS